MPVLIDGYNLLHAARGSLMGSSDLSRVQLSRLLGDWSELSRHRVTVMLDGVSPKEALADQLSDPRITTLYSGAGQTADQCIEAYLEADSAARRILVVSSDHEVQRAARRNGASPVSALAFFELLLERLERTRAARQRGPCEPEEKQKGLSPEDTEDWLAEFGFDVQPPGFEHP